MRWGLVSWIVAVHLAPVEAASAPLKQHQHLRRRGRHRRGRRIGAVEDASAALQQHPRQHHRGEADQSCLGEWSDQILPVRGFASGHMDQKGSFFHLVCPT